MRTKNNNKMTVPHHVEDEDLVSYLDGELALDVREEVCAHLKSCWDCRKRLSTFQRSIENFLEIRQEKLLPPELPPTGPAVDLFRRRLATHRVAVESPSYFRLKLSVWRAEFQALTGRVIFKDFGFLRSHIGLRALAALLVLSVIAGWLVFSTKFNTTVSASELLIRATNVQAEQIRATNQPVIHQRFRVKHRTVGSSSENNFNWEIWNDTVNLRLRQTAFVGENDKLISKSNDPGSMPPDLMELERVLQENRMDSRRPLSAASYQAWSDSVESKDEEVLRSAQTDGIELLTIKTVPAEVVRAGLIKEARLTVRASEWRPISLYLRIKSSVGEDKEYEIVEKHLEVVSLANLPPEFFSDGAVQQVAALPVIKEIPPSSAASPSASPDAVNTPQKEMPAFLSPSSPVIKMPTASNEAEIEVLESLHRIGADVSEQISVSRMPDGRLLVEGIVETEKRKGEVLQSLNSAANNPAIKINIQTIEEASRLVAKQNQKSGGAASENVSTVEVNKGSLAVDTELRSYFSRKGGDTDQQIRNYASVVINRSQSALFQSSALNRLANRFTVNQLRSLEPEARVKWLSIIRQQAKAVRRETAALRQELEPVFFSGVSSGGSGNEDIIVNDADLIKAARNLYEMASGNDRIVRSAFTLSTGSTSISAVKTPQFRRALESAEKLAATLEKAR